MAVLHHDCNPNEANASGHSRMHNDRTESSIAQKLEAFRAVSERPAFGEIGTSLAGAGLPEAGRIVTALRCWLAWEATGAEMDGVDCARLASATAKFPAVLGFGGITARDLATARDAVATMRAAASAGPSSPLGMQCAAALGAPSDAPEVSFLRAAALLFAHGLLELPPCADPANCHCEACEATHEHAPQVVVLAPEGDPVAASFAGTLSRAGASPCPTGNCPIPNRG